MKVIKVVELFAGVGGFRFGLEGKKDLNDKKKKNYKVIWSNQWEPGVKIQYASNIYTSYFGNENHSCEDIQIVIDKKFKSIPNHDLLVGGFPCQDYSVARTLKEAKGLEGKKGVLWWSIYNILKKKGKSAPDFLLLENVDRLLKSPTKQRGRDFAIMLSSLAKLDYAVEWRVINAADYGFPQRRRRIFIMGYKKNTKIRKKIVNCKEKKEWIVNIGVIAKAFKVNQKIGKINNFKINVNPIIVSEKFSKNMPSKSPFENAGVMIDGEVYTIKVEPNYKGEMAKLGKFLINEKDVPGEFFIKFSDKERWCKLKGAKKERRKSSSGHEYNYSEGSMAFPDSLDKPSRTIVTGEGGSSPSRFKHVIRTKSGRLRRLTPFELEKLNMFSGNHTKEVSDTKRAFLMGNALVVGVVKKIGNSLAKFI